MLLQEKTPTPSAPSHRRVMGVCTGPKLLKTKRTIQKENRDHFFFLFVSSSSLLIGGRDKSLEPVTTCLALPQVLYMMPIQICGPFGKEHGLSAAQTFALVSGLTVGESHRSPERHRSASRWRVPPLSRLSSRLRHSG